MTPRTVVLGPRQLGLHEALGLRVVVDEEGLVERVEIAGGLASRGVEALLERTPWVKTLYVVNRVCGVCNTSHSLAYVQAVEELQGIEPPPRAEALRTVALELERLQNNLLTAAVVLEVLGLRHYFVDTMRLREAVLAARQRLTGSRLMNDYVVPGGVARDLPDADAAKEAERLRSLEPRIAQLRGLLESHDVVAGRLRGLAPIPRGEAIAHGLMGPVLRASGVGYDARVAYPHAWYRRRPPRVVVRSEGDSLARLLVRVEEAMEAARLAAEVLEELPRGPSRGRCPPVRRVKPGEAVSRTEAPRGMLLYRVVSRGGVYPARVRIRTPSMPNVLGTLFAYRGVRLEDVPLVLLSMDPCISCMERMVVVRRRRGGEERLLADPRRLARGEKPW